MTKEERLHKGFKLYAKKNRKSFRVSPNFCLIATYLAPGWQWVRKDKSKKRGDPLRRVVAQTKGVATFRSGEIQEMLWA